MAAEIKQKKGKARQAIISPDDFDAVLFDMDGVVTRTAAVHFAAWKKTFDKLLKKISKGKFKPFSQQDYLDYVDGKPRRDGIASFLQARKIRLPYGQEDDPPGYDSVFALANQKQKEFLHVIHTKGVEPYETTVALIRALRSAGLATALVTASKNGAEILRLTRLTRLFDAVVTGVETEQLHLRGKPAPDVYLQAAKELSVKPQRAIVVEDAEAGVQAGRNGRFGMVIGVARQDNFAALKKHGANVVVSDLAEVSVSDQSATHMRGMALADLDITEANWVVTYDKYDPSHEGQRESLSALGNGKFCTRGAAPESKADDIHYPGTYLAGGYNAIEIKTDEGAFEMEELVNLPNWLYLTFKIEDDDWFSLDDVEILSYSQHLNLREGVLYRDLQFRDKHDRITEVNDRRFVHMRYSHLAGLSMVITPINWSGHVTICSAIDGRVTNGGNPIDPKYNEVKHLRVLDLHAKDDIILIRVITESSKLVVAQAARTHVYQAGKKIEAASTHIFEDEFVGQHIVLELKQKQSTEVHKTVALYTSRDRGIYEPETAAMEAVQDAAPFDKLLNSQIDSWKNLWRQFDLFIETDEDCSKLVPSLLLHLNSFHCLQTASPHTVDLDTGVPPRGWTGEGYQGHVFWDDLFVFPFINLRMPNISAALLKYRYRRIIEARKLARAYGAKGACFPWESASDGKERTPSFCWMPKRKTWAPVNTHLEIHVNCAIAYNVWQYYQVTNDNNFMYRYGSEILLEIARFFATYAKFNRRRHRYEIHGVMGPDEYHSAYPNAEKRGINNNAYTNIMASWTICRALELLENMPDDHRQHIRCRLDITDDEIALWEDISGKMFVPIMKNGLLAQFEGYDELKEFPMGKNGQLDHEQLQKELEANLGCLNDYKVTKQADVLMLGFLLSPAELQELIEQLGYDKSCVQLDKMAEFYIPRTANESTLSRVPHAWVLSRLDNAQAARLLAFFRLPEATKDPSEQASPSEEIFYEALGSDYFDVASRGTTNTGIHMAAMAGTVDIVQRCYTGIVTRGDVLWLNPALPKPLVKLSFNINYRGQMLSFDINKDKMRVHALHSSASPIKIGYGKRIYQLNAGDTKIITLIKAKRKGRTRSK